MKVAGPASFRFVGFVPPDLWSPMHLITFLSSFALSLSQTCLSLNIAMTSILLSNIDKVARVGEYAVTACQSVSTEFPFRRGIAASEECYAAASRAPLSREEKKERSAATRTSEKEKRATSIMRGTASFPYANSNRCATGSLYDPSRLPED